MNTQRKVWWLSHRLHQLTNDIEAARFTAGYGAFDVAGIWERVDEMKEEFALEFQPCPKCGGVGEYGSNAVRVSCDCKRVS
jgi:hypothetical protein